MLIWWIQRLFATYRHEGIVELEPAVHGAELGAEELEPYVHPFEIPAGYGDVDRVYGNCGDVALSAKWERANMVLLKDLPGDWNKGRGRMYCHRKVAPALLEALRRCELYGVLDEIETLGCFNYRKMRSNSAKKSYHSWGAAFDINPSDNLAKTFKKGTAPEPFSEEWHKIWPHGVSETLVRAFKEAGFSWGGDWNSYIDGMHMELVGAPALSESVARRAVLPQAKVIRNDQSKF